MKPSMEKLRRQLLTRKHTVATSIIYHRLVDQDDNLRAEIFVSKPVRVADDEWWCPFFVQGTGSNEVRKGIGIDAMQALLVALVGLRTYFEKSMHELRREGGELGDIGIPAVVPSGYGVRMARILEQTMKKTLRQRIAAATKARRKRRARRRQS